MLLAHSLSNCDETNAEGTAWKGPKFKGRDIVYDMCKAVDRGMCLEHIRMLEKAGGKSGHWIVGPARTTNRD